MGFDIDAATNPDMTREKPKSPPSKAISWGDMNIRAPVNPTLTRAKAAVSMQVRTSRARRDRNQTGILTRCMAEPSNMVVPPEISKSTVSNARSFTGG